jgi:hypothetical protein
MLASSKISLSGCRTCASASARSLDAQPEQLESVVRRTSRPEVAFLDISYFHFFVYMGDYTRDRLGVVSEVVNGEW